MTAINASTVINTNTWAEDTNRQHSRSLQLHFFCNRTALLLQLINYIHIGTLTG
eukprot:m.260793 g.260793  ORF g.260793 m.260793 type:complete len:54 (-) comp26651_c0_seq6:137-298(-)